MARYAASTSVSVEKSVAEIQRILQRYGATAFGYGWQGSAALVEFMAAERRIRFLIELPDRAEFKTTPTGLWREPHTVEKAWEQGCRQRWRALVLAVKAKLEAVEAGIATFEEEFAAYIVLPDGRTTWQHMAPAIARAYETNQVQPMLALPAPVGENETDRG